MRWTCLHCGSFRIFNTKPNYKLWSEKPEALVADIAQSQDNNSK